MSTQKIKSVIIEENGGSEKFKVVENEIGAPGEGEILLKHKAVGGDTTFSVLWGQQYIPTPKPTDLTRCVGDFINYAERPSKLPKKEKFISHKDLLSATHINT